jgi:superfamily I DNA/RNA helicase
MAQLTAQQQALVKNPPASRIFIQGAAGSGKTTLGVARMSWLIDQGVAAESILVLSPQRSLARPYAQAAADPTLPAGGHPTIQTLGGLAQRMISLFWPLLPQASLPQHTPPTFLTLETAQYYMARLVAPLIDEQGFFESVTIDRNRLYSQILDNLNKAAGVGFDPQTIGERLSAAWTGQPAQLRVYRDVQDCATRFRAYCLENNLLDFSLHMELFSRHLWPSLLCRAYLKAQYRHLIFDNLEEDLPVVHDILQQWLPDFDSAWLLYDSGGGYRTFLGADPASGAALAQSCEETITLEGSWTSPPEMQAFSQALVARIQHRECDLSPRVRTAMTHISHRFSPQMAAWAAEETARLVNEQGIPPGEIVLLSPYLSDALRFSLMREMEARGIPARTHRPSRSLRDEPATHCLLTLARLANPQWGLKPTRSEVREALLQSIQDLDLVRADLLAQTVYNPRSGALNPFDRLNPEMRQRITYSLGERYEILRTWLCNSHSAEISSPGEASPPPLEVQELDTFVSRIFGELLSQPGYGYEQNYDAAAVTARLIDSIRKFRWARTNAPENQLGPEYLQMVAGGVLAAQYLQPVDLDDENAVLIAPAYTYLMSNRPTTVQFWLDAGSPGWWERLNQPLTHPYVLSRAWQAGARWTDQEEYNFNQAALARLVEGLTCRCKQHIYLCTSILNEQGEEPRGPLLQAIQGILRRLTAAEED